jgi:hypothetical protein
LQITSGQLPLTAKLRASVTAISDSVWLYVRFCTQPYSRYALPSRSRRSRLMYLQQQQQQHV